MDGVSNVGDTFSLQYMVLIVLVQSSSSSSLQISIRRASTNV